MCDNCDDIILRKSFCSKEDYLSCLKYISEILSTGKFELVSATCNLDKVLNESGRWSRDDFFHIVRCKKCGSLFKAYANTYRGGGSFARVQ